MSYDLTSTAGLERLIGDLGCEIPIPVIAPAQREALNALLDRYRTHCPVMLPCRAYVAGWEQLCRKVADELCRATGAEYTDAFAAAIQVISLLSTGDAYAIMQSENKRPGLLRRLRWAIVPRKQPLPHVYELAAAWTPEQQQAFLGEQGFVEIYPGPGKAMIARAKAGIMQGPGLCSCGCRIVDGRCEYCGKAGHYRRSPHMKFLGAAWRAEFWRCFWPPRIISWRYFLAGVVVGILGWTLLAFMAWHLGR